jgi:uncharacterized protein
MSPITTASRSPETVPDAPDIARRVMDLDWAKIEQGLWERGFAKSGPIATPAECGDLIELYRDDTRFRSRVEMARYRFGKGEYKYFAHPLPSLVQQIRTAAYAQLAPVADRWMKALALPCLYPADLEAFLEICAARGQPKPAALLLQYREGDYNCLHQDVLGEVAFPFQLTLSLNRRDVDYRGGEFVLVEQSRGAPSRPEVVTLEQGEFVAFTTDRRPAPAKRGYRRARLWHGVSRVISGRRYSLGVIFHNSK